MSQKTDIFTILDLNYEQNNESAPHNDSATPKLPLSYDIATNLADAISLDSTFENFILSDHKSRDAETVAVLLTYKRDSNPVKFILSHSWLGCNGNIALALALSLSLSQVFSIQELNLTIDDDGAIA